jgi:hypothetical protein
LTSDRGNFILLSTINSLISDSLFGATNQPITSTTFINHSFVVKSNADGLT